MQAFADLVQFAEVGAGTIDFGAVIPQALASGAEYLLVEQDELYGRDAYDCLADSIGAHPRASATEPASTSPGSAVDAKVARRPRRARTRTFHRSGATSRGRGGDRPAGSWRPRLQRPRQPLAFAAGRTLARPRAHVGELRGGRR